MKLRNLELKDAPFMLEWMQDISVVEYMHINFAKKKIDDCESFIEESKCDKNNFHMAIVNDKDEYMGTVSLKRITDSNAEFAIVVRKCAMGKGYSKYGMKKIMKYGFDKIGLDYIYWCVLPDNKRAVRFYDKNGCQRVKPPEIRGGGVYGRTNQAFYLVQSGQKSYQREVNQINTFKVSSLGTIIAN